LIHPWKDPIEGHPNNYTQFFREDYDNGEGGYGHGEVNKANSIMNWEHLIHEQCKDAIRVAKELCGIMDGEEYLVEPLEESIDEDLPLEILEELYKLASKLVF